MLRTTVESDMNWNEKDFDSNKSPRDHVHKSCFYLLTANMRDVLIPLMTVRYLFLFLSLLNQHDVYFRAVMAP